MKGWDNKLFSQGLRDQAATVAFAKLSDAEAQPIGELRAIVE